MKKIIFILLSGLLGQAHAAVISSDGVNFSYGDDGKGGLLQWTSSFNYLDPDGNIIQLSSLLE